MRTRWMGWIQPIILGLAIIFVIVLLVGQWGELAAYPWRLHGGWLGFSGLMMVLSWGIEIGLWRRILGLVVQGGGHRNTEEQKHKNGLLQSSEDVNGCEDSGHRNTEEQKHKNGLSQSSEDVNGCEDSEHRNTEEQKHKNGHAGPRITHHESRITNHESRSIPTP